MGKLSEASLLSTLIFATVSCHAIVTCLVAVKVV